MSSQRKIFLFVAVPLLLAFAGIILYVSHHKMDRTSQTASPDAAGNTADADERQAATVSWEFNGEKWVVSGTPPACPEPLAVAAPTDTTKAVSMLYPGQERTGGYKAHGGFRFPEGSNKTITVTVPLDAQLVEGSRYLEQGEIQYLFTFIHPCGLAYRFDHLYTLSPKFQALADQLPEAKVDDSRTTRFEPPVSVTTGEALATAVGFVTTQNSSFDFGVYDLRAKNKISQDTTWTAAHQKEQQFAAHGLCWFDLLPAADAARVKSLPASANDGAKSDYCS